MTLANLTACGTVRVTLELSPNCAAALMRFAQKVTFEQAGAVLYPHVHADIRSDQAAEIISALSHLERVLADADVSAWPWIDTGRA